MYAEEYHHKTDARKMKRCEAVLEKAISELMARRNGMGGRGSLPRRRK
jgi:hypothetical protein